jgi:DNA polymerase-2
VFQDGEIKYRGIELRRHDTSPLVAKTQLAVLQCLVQVATLEQVRDYIPKAHKIVEQAKRDLKASCIPMEDLLITQRLSKEMDAYKSPSPAARAARQLVEMGKDVAPGQSILFIYTLGKPGVWVYGAKEFNKKTLDVEQYSKLLQRASMTILEPFV